MENNLVIKLRKNYTPRSSQDFHIKVGKIGTLQVVGWDSKSMELTIVLALHLVPRES